jgi:hypothetical protein
MTPDGVGDGILIEGELIVPAHPEITAVIPPDGTGTETGQAMLLLSRVMIALGTERAAEVKAIADIVMGGERIASLEDVIAVTARYVTLVPDEG